VARRSWRGRLCELIGENVDAAIADESRRPGAEPHVRRRPPAERAIPLAGGFAASESLVLIAEPRVTVCRLEQTETQVVPFVRDHPLAAVEIVERLLNGAKRVNSRAVPATISS